MIKIPYYQTREIGFQVPSGYIVGKEDHERQVVYYYWYLQAIGVRIRERVKVALWCAVIKARRLFAANLPQKYQKLDIGPKHWAKPDVPRPTITWGELKGLISYSCEEEWEGK